MSRGQIAGAEPVLHVAGVKKSYGDLRAVDGIDFTVGRGEIFGLLGPNGAGKTTTLSILEGLRRPDAGSVRVFGLDISAHAPEIKRRMGVQLQKTSLLADLTCREQVQLFAELYGRPLDRAAALALLARLGLAERADALPPRMSGGQQQRLALALALVNDPDLVFLDEPTSGLDPQSRRALWELIRAWRADGRTVVITTHYMEEAAELCDRVGIIDHGRLLALDSPHVLIRALKGVASIVFGECLPDADLRKLPGVLTAESTAGTTRIRTAEIVTALEALLRAAKRKGAALSDLHIQQPSLEDVFLQLTGRRIRE